MAGADISITYDDCSDDLTDEGFEQGDCSSSRTSRDDESLLLRVGNYAYSTQYSDRQWLPKEIQEIFRTVPANLIAKDLQSIMKMLLEMAKDANLVNDVLENVPNLAAQAIGNSERCPALKDVVGEYLIPLVVRHVGNYDTGVDKKAQAALVQMIERGYITKFEAEIKICPTILALTKMENQESVNTSAVTLMSKLAPPLGRDITERILLKRFTELCSSNLFYIRKVATSHFGYYCSIVGKDAFEQMLLPCYLALCQDDIWGVRKSCAEVIMFISCVCPPELRRTLLAAAFTKLLQDECRWVKIAAYQTLGAFIITFAEPPLTTIYQNAVGELVMYDMDGNEYHPNDLAGFPGPGTLCSDELVTLTLRDLLGDDTVVYKTNDKDQSKAANSASIDDEETGDINESLKTEESSRKQSIVAEHRLETESTETRNGSPTPVDQIENVVDIGIVKIENSEGQRNRILQCKEGKKHEDDLLSYNEYNYWYISPTNVDLEGLADVGEALHSEKLSESSSEDIVTNHLEELYATISLNDSDSADRRDMSIEPSSDNKGDNNLDNKNRDVSTVNSSTVEVEEPTQKIVPQNLIYYFVSMAHYEASVHDMDMALYCAYTLPAVVLTLGKENWPLMRVTMESLAGHMSYKIRRTVANSLHDIALILGPDLASETLTPLFEGFLKDLDEVRVGLLNNLFQFLQLIKPEKRATFLPKLGEFFRVDDVCNWRFKEKLAEQLTQCVKLFSPVDIVKHMGLYAQAFLLHNVAAVRQAAMALVAEIVKQISQDHGLVSSYLSVIAERFAHSKKWKARQTFAIVCAELLKKDAMELEEFATVLLPHLLDLSWDPVANIRLVVANCIVNHIINKEHFADPANEHIEPLTNVLRRLQADRDRDVRMSADFVEG